MGVDRGYSSAGSRDENRNSEAEIRSRGRSAARQRRALYRQPQQVEHPRAGGIVDPAPRVRLADGTGSHGAARAGRPARGPSSRGAGRHGRHDPEVRRRLLPDETRGSEITQSLEVHCDATPGGDVSLQGVDERVAAGDWQGLRRQTSLDGDPLAAENRKAAAKRSGVQHGYQQPARVISLALTGSIRGPSTASTARAVRVLWAPAKGVFLHRISTAISADRPRIHAQFKLLNLNDLEVA